jgi:hypothetical protein
MIDWDEYERECKELQLSDLLRVFVTGCNSEDLADSLKASYAGHELDRRFPLKEDSDDR